jgi:hypothetical protein
LAVLDGLLLPSQLPKPAWHPVPQYADVLPHHPLPEQQSPKLDPKHVKPPFVLPQVASVDTFFVGVEAAAVDERVEVRTTKVELVRFVEVTGLLPLHVPNFD